MLIQTGLMNGLLAKLLEIHKKCSPRDIYNADETGLFCPAIPLGSLLIVDG